MNIYWTKNLRTPEEKEKFQNSVLGSKLVLERLVQILNEEEAELDRSEASTSQYDSPSWSSLQAHRNGDRSRLRWMKALLNLDQQKD